VKGLPQIVETAMRPRDSNEPCVLATVVKVAGSAYRRPGSRMLFPPGEAPVGMVSGGCLEGDLAERAETVRRSGRTQTVVYDMRSPDDIVWGLGLGCNGEIRVLLEVFAPGRLPDYLRFLGDCHRDRRPGVVATVFDATDPTLAAGDRLIVDDQGVVVAPLGGTPADAILDDARAALARRKSMVCRYETADGSCEALIEFAAPRPHLLLFGAGQDVSPVATMAGGLGWQITVLDNRESYATPERFPEADTVRAVDFDRLVAHELKIDAATAAVVMTHHFLHDETVLRLLLTTEAPYIGLLGPRKRSRMLLERLQSDGRIQRTSLGRVHGPVGLDIGSETPEEIALAVVAEIQARLTGRTGGSLRDRELPLHDWPQ
jgi:xanthine/CO dehydrogenase XdhC/CoxF family maturation factor